MSSENKTTPTVLSIAGSDSGAGAGIQADLKTFAALKVYGMTAITSITAQNTIGVQGVFDLPVDIIAMQIDSVAADIGVDAVKTGMLSSPGIVEIVAHCIKKHGFSNVVVDPVIKATDKTRLLAPEARKALIEKLFVLAMVVTPNLDEASQFLGREVKNLAQMRDAARAIYQMGPKYVVVKGGHLCGDPIDLLFDGRVFIEFPQKRYKTKNTHGTGCTFASAIAAGLACNMDINQAVDRAGKFVAQAIKHSLDLGHGHGPINQFFHAT